MSNINILLQLSLINLLINLIQEWVSFGDKNEPLNLDGYKVIPYIPEGVRELSCNSAEWLPDLPETLEVLVAKNLKVLPNVTKLKKLIHLSAESLKILPKLPESMEYLYVDNVPIITELPDSITDLVARKAIRLPEKLPKNLKRLVVSRAKNVFCLPDGLEDLYWG